MTILDEGKRTARKAHICNQCSRVIQPGETYVYWTSAYDRDLMTTKECLQCHAFSADLFAAGVVGEDLYSGSDCYPYLPEVEHNYGMPAGDVWVARLALYLRQWRDDAGNLATYPSDTATTTGDTDA